MDSEGQKVIEAALFDAIKQASAGGWIEVPTLSDLNASTTELRDALHALRNQGLIGLYATRRG